MLSNILNNRKSARYQNLLLAKAFLEWYFSHLVLTENVVVANGF